MIKSVQEIEAMCAATAKGIRPTTDEEKLNKLEKDYLEWLRACGDWWICVQAITLKIGYDTRLTLDFWALDERGLRAIDVKGFQREDALIKIKVAARMYPFIRFLIAKRNGGVWEHKEIKP
jgi:deoxycytidine triphosphate deaminase